MKMKKLMALALAGIMMLGVLSGCGGKKSEPSTGSGASDSKAVEITFPSMWVGVNSNTPWFEDRMAAFNEQYGDQIKVTVEEIAGDQNYVDKMKVLYSSNWYGKREDAYMSNETGVSRAKKPYHFDIYEKDAGGYAGVALKYMRAKNSGKESEMILCVPNEGAIPGLLDTDVVEITCTLKDGVYIPHKIEHPGQLQMELIRRVKMYERLASEALRTKSISKAVDCLMVHPLVNSYSLASQLVQEYLESNKDYTEGWH